MGDDRESEKSHELARSAFESCFIVLRDLLRRWGMTDDVEVHFDHPYICSVLISSTERPFCRYTKRGQAFSARFNIENLKCRELERRLLFEEAVSTGELLWLSVALPSDTEACSRCLLETSTVNSCL